MFSRNAYLLNLIDFLVPVAKALLAILILIVGLVLVIGLIKYVTRKKKPAKPPEGSP